MWPLCTNFSSTAPLMPAASSLLYGSPQQKSIAPLMTSVGAVIAPSSGRRSIVVLLPASDGAAENGTIARA